MRTPSSVWTHQPYGHPAVELPRFANNPYGVPALPQPIEEKLVQGIHLLDTATGSLLDVDAPTTVFGNAPQWIMDEPVRLVIGQLPNKKFDRAAVVRKLVAIAAELELPSTLLLSMQMAGPFIAKITVPRLLATKLQQLSGRYHALTATFVPGPSRPISVQVDPEAV